MVIGGPVGTFISDAAGWRGGFWAVVAVTAISAVAGLAALPAKTPGKPPCRTWAWNCVP